MGKKRVAKQTQEEILKETELIEASERKASQTSRSKRKKKLGSVPYGRVYIQSSYNNTLVTLTDPKGNILAWASAGSVGFKGPKKATPFAASKVIKALIDKVSDLGLKEVSVFVKGVGSGREAAIRALANHGLEISSIKDITPIPHNGCRPPRPRRV